MLLISGHIIKKTWFYCKIHVVFQSQKSIVSSNWMVLILAKRRQHIEIYRKMESQNRKTSSACKVRLGLYDQNSFEEFKTKDYEETDRKRGRETVNTPKTFTDSKVCLYCDTDHLVSGNSKGKADTLSFTHAVESEFLYYYK